MVTTFEWRSALEDLFAGSVNQDTLEEAADLMVAVSAQDQPYHERIVAMLDAGMRAAAAGDASVIGCINRSGYQVATTQQAGVLLTEFRDIYLREYDRARQPGRA